MIEFSREQLLGECFCGGKATTAVRLIDAATMPALMRAPRVQRATDRGRERGGVTEELAANKRGEMRGLVRCCMQKARTQSVVNDAATVQSRCSIDCLRSVTVQLTGALLYLEADSKIT
jgi:hypothetical protein